MFAYIYKLWHTSKIKEGGNTFLTFSKEKKHNLSNYIRLINRPKKSDGNLENWERKKFYSLPRNGRSSSANICVVSKYRGENFDSTFALKLARGNDDDGGDDDKHCRALRESINRGIPRSAAIETRFHC